MSHFRVVSGPVKKLLVALSFGCCSLSLLALLEKQLEFMKLKTSRVGYEVCALHVLGADAHVELASALQKLKQLEAMFPMFNFYSVPLKDALPDAQSDTPQEQTPFYRLRMLLSILYIRSCHGLLERLVKCYRIGHRDGVVHIIHRVFLHRCMGR